MSGGDWTVVHVIGPEGATLDRLRLPWILEGIPARHQVIRLGASRPGLPPEHRPRPAPLPWGCAWLGTPGLRRAVRAATGCPQRTILHTWSVTALRCALPLGDIVAGIVSEVECAAAGAAAGALDPLRPAGCRLHFVAATAEARERLVGSGVPGERVELLAGVATTDGPGDDGRRQAARARLGLTAAQHAWLVLPPVTRESGFLAAWAAMIVEQVRAEVRLIVPGWGDIERVRWLVRCCGREHLLRVARPSMGLGELLAAADCGLFIHRADAPREALVRALAAGLPVLAAGTGARTGPALECGAVGAGHPERQPGGVREMELAAPRAIAAETLVLLEDLPKAQAAAQHAREEALRRYGPDAARRLYSDIYLRLARDDR